MSYIYIMYKLNNILIFSVKKIKSQKKLSRHEWIKYTIFLYVTSDFLLSLFQQYINYKYKQNHKHFMHLYCVLLYPILLSIYF